MTIGVNLNTDIKEGVFDRFRSLPIARSAPLMGAVLGEMVRFVIASVFVIGFGYVIGFRVHTNALMRWQQSLLVLFFALVLLLGLGVHRDAGARAGRRAGLRLPADVSADVRKLDLRPGRDAAGMAAGLGARQSGDASRARQRED